MRGDGIRTTSHLLRLRQRPILRVFTTVHMKGGAFATGIRVQDLVCPPFFTPTVGGGGGTKRCWRRWRGTPRPWLHCTSLLRAWTRTGLQQELRDDFRLVSRRPSVPPVRETSSKHATVNTVVNFHARPPDEPSVNFRSLPFRPLDFRGELELNLRVLGQTQARRPILRFDVVLAHICDVCFFETHMDVSVSSTSGDRSNQKGCKRKLDAEDGRTDRHDVVVEVRSGRGHVHVRSTTCCRERCASTDAVLTDEGTGDARDEEARTSQESHGRWRGARSGERDQERLARTCRTGEIWCAKRSET